MTTAGDIEIRPLGSPGDLGWIVLRHAELFSAEQGWSTGFEEATLEIAIGFARSPSPRQAGWIATLDGARAGSVLVVPTEDPTTARVRVLLVDPTARGRGTGGRLVRRCIEFAREAGYETLTLSTMTQLTTARRIYDELGFVLTTSERRHRFGAEVTDEQWDLQLSPASTPVRAGRGGRGGRGGRDGTGNT
ncbi:GNAT family N-acetyltransferase [Kineococcus sp. GCM10028916]|uniref:GNAT family N-acetyltransferase n=1 Tax=Kineococcus sp. GCM10028916 TaxID=3273394 RepID=UPI00362AC5E7